MRLTAEALGLRCQILGFLGWYATLIYVDGHSLLEGLDVRDKGWVRCRGSAHALARSSLLRCGSLMSSTISRFCALPMPPE